MDGYSQINAACRPEFTTQQCSRFLPTEMCGGCIMLTPQNRNRQVLSSPHYPYEYPANLECVWKIIAPKGYAIKLSFHDFDVEWDQNCEYDFLDILLLNMHGEPMRYKSITHIYNKFLPERLHSYGTQSVLTVRNTCVALISLV